MFFTFAPKEFNEVLEGCLDAFSEHVVITGYLHAIKELLLAGMDEYRRTGGIQLLHHTAFGFRSMASLAKKEMMMTLWQEVFKNRMAVVKSDSVSSIKEKWARLIKRKEAVEAWCDFWKIEAGSLEVNLYDLYHKLYQGETTL